MNEMNGNHQRDSTNDIYLKEGIEPIKINWIINLIRGQFVVVKKIQGIVYSMCTSMDLLDGVSHFVSILP